MRHIETRRAEGIARGGRHRQCGLTMVELLVAMAVGLFLLAGIVQLLVSSKTSYRAEEAFSRLQENGRFAMQSIARDARMARSMGCRSLMLDEVMDTLNVVACDLLKNAHKENPACTGDPYISIETPLGYDAGYYADSDDEDAVAAARANGDWADLPGVVDDRWRRGDVLMLWGVWGGLTYVSGALQNFTSGVLIPAANGTLQEDAIVLITDCEGSDLFTVSATANGALMHNLNNTQGTQVNSSDSLSRFYNKASTALAPGAVNKAMVFPFDFRIYFVCNSNSAQTGSSLCRWRPSDGVQELVPDIVDMRLTYASDTDGDGSPNYDNNPPTAHAITDWQSVYSAQVELLAASAEEVRSADEAIDISGWPGTDEDKLGRGLLPDRRVYARFAFNVALRTRTPWYVAP